MQIDSMQPGFPVPLTQVLDLLVDAVCVVDVEGRYLFVSAAFERIFGYAPEEVIGRSMLDLIHPDDRERTLLAAGEIMAGDAKPHFQNRYVRKDGRVVDIMWSARWSPDHGMRIAVARDITALKHAEAMQASLHALAEAVNASEDLKELFARVAAIMAKLLPGAELLLAPDGAGKRHDGWINVPLLSGDGTSMGALLAHGGAGMPALGDAELSLLQFLATPISAAIERKQAQLRLQHLARHDPLTDLPNRELFHERLRAALALARDAGSPLALLYLDLDGFKQVNDRYGHAFGDQLLQQAAIRIRGCVRESDTVGRLGGDEFVVVLANIGQRKHAEAVAEKIRAALARPLLIEGREVHATASLGIALFPEHGEDGDLLVRHADDAMYAAKKQGGDRSCVALAPEPALPASIRQAQPA